MTSNEEMTDESSWIWLTSEQMEFLLRSEFVNENHGEARSNDQRTDQTTFFLAPIITDFIRNTKRELHNEKLTDALEMLDLESSGNFFRRALARQRATLREFSASS